MLDYPMTEVRFKDYMKFKFLKIVLFSKNKAKCTSANQFLKERKKKFYNAIIDNFHAFILLAVIKLI